MNLLVNEKRRKKLDRNITSNTKPTQLFSVETLFCTIIKLLIQIKLAIYLKKHRIQTQRGMLQTQILNHASNRLFLYICRVPYSGYLHRWKLFTLGRASIAVYRVAF